MRALIVEDGTQRGALAAVRSLGEAGCDVGVAAPRTALSSRSRSCRRTHLISAPTAGAVFVSSVAEVASGYDVVFPIGDAELFSLSERRAQIPALLPWPSHETVRSCLDKGMIMARAEASGISVPRSFEVDEYDGTSGVFVKELLHGERRADAVAPRSAAVPAAGTEEVRAAVERVRVAGGRPLLQAAIAGDLVAYCVFRDRRGRKVAEVQQVATATYPPQAGVSTRAETEEVDHRLASNAEKLLDDVGAWGVVEMQFIRDAAGTSHLIDVNPRFYGSMGLAIAAGADLPLLLARDATHQPVSSAPARTGVRYQWLEGDLRRAAIERRGGAARDIAVTLTYARGAVHSIWSRDDPAPALWFATRLGRRALRKAIPWT